MASSIQERITINTSSGLDCDFQNLKERVFIGNLAFSGAKTVSFRNDTNALSVILEVPITTSATITFPSSCLFQSTETRWNTGTKVLTLTGTGTYILGGVFDGTNWRFKASDDGGYV